MALVFGQAGKAGFQVFFDREERENLAALRDVGHAFLGQHMRLDLANLFAIQLVAAATVGMGARHRLEQAGLAHTIGAHHASDLTDAGGCINAVQDLAAAVMQRQVFDIEEVIGQGTPR